MTAEIATRTRTVTLEPSVKGLDVSVDLIALVGPHAHPSEAALRRAGYAVRLVRSIAEALTPLPQLIVVDVGSIESGYQLQLLCRLVPVIGLGDDAGLVVAYDRGVTDYQPTTIDGPELAARVRRIIRRDQVVVPGSRYIFQSPTLSLWRWKTVLEWQGREVGLSLPHWRILKELARECGSFRSVHELTQVNDETDDSYGWAAIHSRIYFLRRKLTRITGIGPCDLIVQKKPHGYRLALPSLEA